MALLELYKAIVKSLNFTVSQEGHLTYVFEGEEYPALIDGKRLTLPTPEILRNGNWDNLVAFHPLSENPLRGESPVLKKLKDVINHRLSAVISDLLFQLADLGNDTSRHRSLNPKAAGVLSTMSNIDDKFVDNLRKILSKQANQGPNRLISLYLKRGGTYKGQKYARVAVVAFPILEQIAEESDTIFGVPVRKKDRQILDAMFKYILPDADVIETYNAPSRSMTTPYLDALLHAFANVATALNSVIHQQRKQLSNEDELRTDLSWLEHVKDLSVYEGLIPALPGNEGEGGVDTPAPAAVAAQAPSKQQETFKVQAHTLHGKKDDEAPWKEEPVKVGKVGEKPNRNPFNVDAVTKMDQAFHAAATVASTQFQAGGGKDPNAFERPPGYKPEKGEKDYAEWMAKRNKAAAAAAPTTFGVGYGQNQFAPATAVPAWAAPAMPAPVAPGEYAGRVRGALVHPVYGPAWQTRNPPYGYAPQGPQYVGGGSVHPTIHVPANGGFSGAL